MATITGIPRSSTPRDEKVYHPLDQLRGIIRRYVVVEGVLSALIFLGAWFALALVLDFGVFKAFTWDWVQDGGRWIRGAALVAALLLLAGIIVFRIVRRLTTELSYPALALVLERRFPKVLGDRLITAVELADVEKAAGYGYSAEMIRQTIDEAREKVGTVPVREVFNWRRLWVMGILAVGIPILVVVAAFVSHAVATRAFLPGHAAWKFYHVSTILGERDLLLMNTPWPRRALLELQDVPDTGLRVARDGAAPRVKVKSYRWVFADRTRPDGWRPLLWSDVTPSLVGMPVPELPFQSMNRSDEPSTRAALGGAAGGPAMGTTTTFPDDSATLPTDPAAWTVDAVFERARNDAAIRAKLGAKMGSDFQALESVFDRLEAMADDPAYGRRLRRLDPPGDVSYSYTGLKTAGSGPLNPEGKSEHVGDISGLKEDVQFVIKAEDYRTPPRTITLIPPPTLTKLARVEFQPAYLHYAPPMISNPERPNDPPVRSGYPELRGLRQQMAEEKVSLTGDKSVFVVPTGTEVVLSGTTELPITKAFIRPKVGRVPGAKAGSADLVPLTLTDDHTFTIEFRNEYRLTTAVEFDFVYENADKIQSQRPVLIQVTDDQAPVVQISTDIIRRVGNVYYVTPRAKIPFNAAESVITDDNGLSKVEYTATFYAQDTDDVRGLRVATALRGFVAPSGPGASRLPVALQSAYHTSAFRKLDAGDTRQNATYLQGTFVGLENAIKRETKGHLLSLLSQPPAGEKVELVKRVALTTRLVPNPTRRPNGSLERFQWDVEGDFFDVKALGLEKPPGEAQPRYMIDLNMQATDTNFDTGPKSSRNTEAIRLLVVSEGDLLFEIGKEEETLGNKLDEALAKLASAKSSYAFVNSKHFTRLPDEIDAVSNRSKVASQSVMSARDIVQNVARDYRKIERECVVNLVDPKTVAAYGKLANWIDRVLGETPQVVSPDEDERLREGKLNPATTFPQAEKLIATAQVALDERRYAEPGLVIDADIAINNLEREVSEIRRAIGEAQNKDKLRKELTLLIERQKRVRGDLLEMKRIYEDLTTKPTPALQPVGAVFLAKGETKKIKQGIHWRQYKEDTLVVKVASSDAAAVIVPAELKLDFEKNDVSFEYELRAGSKEGEYTVTLTPAVGDKVEVKVTVK